VPDITFSSQSGTQPPHPDVTLPEPDGHWLADQLNAVPLASLLRTEAQTLASRVRAAAAPGVPNLIELEPAEDSCIVEAVWAATSDPPSGRIEINRLARACLARRDAVQAG
jgi:hypothetical protein